MLEQAFEQAAETSQSSGFEVDIEDMKLPVDEGLQVVFESVPADAWDESHAHAVPQQDTIVLHLVPPEAQEFDEQMREFIDEADIEEESL
jgi:hypothetical protein